MGHGRVRSQGLGRSSQSSRRGGVRRRWVFMRVLHVTDTYLPRRGGIELHVHDLAMAQRQAGDEADVLTLTRARDVTPAQSAGTLIRPGVGAGLLDKARFVHANRRFGLHNDYDV